MTAFTFSLEQLRSAPPEVQRWVAGEIARSLGTVGLVRPEPRPAQATAPAACTAAQAVQVFELIGGDPVVARLFFELARETTLNTNVPGLHAVRMADLLHHAGFSGQDSLIEGLAVIDQAFRQVNGDASASLFGFDESGHVFLQEATQVSIRRIWDELLQARAHAPGSEAAPRFEGFSPPRVGPSEDVAAHAAQPPGGRDRPF